MVDRPRRPCPPAFSWNGGMVQHVLKGDPALRDLEHVQVDGPGLMYLFFYDWHGYVVSPRRRPSPCLLTHSRCLCRVDWEIRTLSMRFPYCWRQDGKCVTAMQERCRQCIWPLEQPALPVHASESTGSGSSQLVGGVPPVPEAQEGVVEQEMPRVNAARPRR